MGILKVLPKRSNKKINCINLDAHSDFRSLEHRHSGNGFSYAYENGFLEKYFIFGLHRNYTSEAIFSEMNSKSENLQYLLFEDLSINGKIAFSEGIEKAENFCCHAPFGIELDMDAIENMGSSAMSPSGFTLNEARNYAYNFSKHNNACYVHICEGSPRAEIFPNQVGKTISYLLSDVISG